MFVPRINPISGRTLNEEIAIARSIGGRLPFSVYLDLIRRGVIKEPIQKKRERRTSVRRVTKRRDSP